MEHFYPKTPMEQDHTRRYLGRTDTYNETQNTLYQPKKSKSKYSNHTDEGFVQYFVGGQRTWGNREKYLPGSVIKTTI